MAGPRTTVGSSDLGARLRTRRAELGLTIEQAATAAGIGSESWRRYEQGGSIRQDKVRGVCRALRWPALPVADAGVHAAEPDEPVENSRAYSHSLAEWPGEACAQAFARGYDLVVDGIKNDTAQLSSMPRGTHVGELGVSWLEGWLPGRWLTRYDHEFCYRLLATADALRLRLVHPGYDGNLHLTRCPADDLMLHVILEQGAVSFDLGEGHPLAAEVLADWEEWEYELNGEDDEVIAALYSDFVHPATDHQWHVERWFEPVDYAAREPEGAAAPTEPAAG